MERQRRQGEWRGDVDRVNGVGEMRRQRRQGGMEEAKSQRPSGPGERCWRNGGGNVDRVNGEATSTGWSGGGKSQRPFGLGERCWRNGGGNIDRVNGEAASTGWSGGGKVAKTIWSRPQTRSCWRLFLPLWVASRGSSCRLNIGQDATVSRRRDEFGPGDAAVGLVLPLLACFVRLEANPGQTRVPPYLKAVAGYLEISLASVEIQPGYWSFHFGFAIVKLAVVELAVVKLAAVKLAVVGSIGHLNHLNTGAKSVAGAGGRGVAGYLRLESGAVETTPNRWSFRFRYRETQILRPRSSRTNPGAGTYQTGISLPKRRGWLPRGQGTDECGGDSARLLVLPFWFTVVRLAHLHWGKVSHWERAADRLTVVKLASAGHWGKVSYSPS
ncbi:hypothetical protein MAPG_10741 [Magnaporthiopsis poae ATCC 64411]|uniref:Uncharacterized protein n=1 Tax=Magnaporthiopsis poae (strain ATCC 64411 / 73-15) TaxID=644358 RepID=A0A0C4EDE3_MAGP6|nr:hypothetical protein MAPG_10741 [Magnaporthiopsis poae ATCC 64411]